MYYFVQSNIYNDPEHDSIFEVLEDLNLPYETLILEPDTTHANVNTNRTDIFVYGSVKLARLAKANNQWTPGSFYGDNHRFEAHAPHYKEHLLNYTTTVFQLTDSIEWAPNEEKFIKPYRDAKVFTGKVFTELKWNDFVAASLQNPRSPLLNAQTYVQASAPQQLIKEARMWVIGGQVITGVYYKFHGDVPYQTRVSDDGFAFAQSMVDLFSVADAFVMDIGLTFDGWKIVEINCINSAGFYQANVRTIIRALEAYFS